MEGMISVREAMNKYPELETIMGYSENQLEDLIRNGEIIGLIDHSNRKVFMDRDHLKDLVAICNDHEFDPNCDQDEEDSNHIVEE
jgi:hypothetical protein